MSVDGVLPGSILVKIELPEVGPSIDFFEASVKDGTTAQRCTVRPSTNPLQCQIDGLTGGKTPTVVVRSCVPGNNACSSAVEKVIIFRMSYLFVSVLVS